MVVLFVLYYHECKYERCTYAGETDAFFYAEAHIGLLYIFSENNCLCAKYIEKNCKNIFSFLKKLLYNLTGEW